jgi:hypothetical protein
MSVTLAPPMFLQFWQPNNSGVVASGYKLFSYLAGTTTKQPTWSDSSQVTQNANPIILDANGVASTAAGTQVWGDPTIAYKFVWAPPNDTDPPTSPIRTVDNFYFPLSALTPGVAQNYPQTTVEINAGVTPTSTIYPPGNVLRYGADPTGVAVSTLAFTNAWVCYKTIYAPTGSYLVDTINIPSTFYQRTLYGDGPGRTTLNQLALNNDTILLGTSGTNEHTIEIRDLSLIGAGTGGTANGIHLMANSPLPPSNFKVSRVQIANYGNSGIYDQAGAFCTVLDNVQITGCGGHQFDMLGGNTLMFINCYAQIVPTVARSGYRVHSSFPTFLNCTGINGGSWWGIFGDTVAEDGVLNYCVPLILGCDMESFTTGAIRNKNSSCFIHNTHIICTASNVIGAQVNGQPGTIDAYESTFQLSSGSWLNGFPIHQIATGLAPFDFIGKGQSTTPITFWNDADSASHTMSIFTQTPVATNRWAVAPYDLYVLGLLRNAFSGTTAFSAATTATVTFAGGASQPDSSYGVAISANANKTFWVTAKGTTGFTLNASGSSSDSVDWFVFRPA